MWVWRGLAAAAAMLVLFGVGVAVATGPITSAPRLPLAADSSMEASGVEDRAPQAQPLPTSATELPNSLDDSPMYLPQEQRPLAVFLGDSITRGATVDSTWGDVTEWSWFYRLIDDSEGIVRYGGMVAENGVSTSWMADQVYQALALSPDVLVVHGGTNDISGEVDPQYVIGNLQRVKDAADSYGIPMAVCTIPPRWDPAADARAIALNAALEVWAEEEDVLLLDTAAPLRAPTGGWLPGYSADGLHPTPAAAVLMARAAAEGLRGIPGGV